MTTTQHVRVWRLIVVFTLMVVVVCECEKERMGGTVFVVNVWYKNKYYCTKPLPRLQDARSGEKKSVSGSLSSCEIRSSRYVKYVRL